MISILALKKILTFVLLCLKWAFVNSIYLGIAF